MIEQSPAERPTLKAAQKKERSMTGRARRATLAACLALLGPPLPGLTTLMMVVEAVKGPGGLECHTPKECKRLRCGAPFHPLVSNNPLFL